MNNFFDFLIQPTIDQLKKTDKALEDLEKASQLISEGLTLSEQEDLQSEELSLRDEALNDLNNDNQL